LTLVKSASSAAGTTEGYVRVENHDNGIRHVIMDRPPVNSLSLEMLSALDCALQTIKSDPEARGILLTSASRKVFCAGLDITEMHNPNLERLQNFWRQLQNTWLTLYGFPLPVVAAMHGAAPAGGCLLAMSCDYRVMSPGTPIGLNETQLGIVAPWWFSEVMKNTVGHRQTEILLQLGKMVKSEDAAVIGLVDDVIATENLTEHSSNVLLDFAKIPSLARNETKQMMRRPILDRLEQEQQQDVDFFVDFITRDTQQKSLGGYLQMLASRSKAKSKAKN